MTKSKGEILADKFNCGVIEMQKRFGNENYHIILDAMRAWGNQCVSEERATREQLANNYQELCNDYKELADNLEMQTNRCIELSEQLEKNKETINLKIRTILNSELAIFHSDGTKVYEILQSKIRVGNRVVMDFTGLERASVQFLNACLGRCYLEFGVNVIDELVTYNYANMGRLEQKIFIVRDNVRTHTHQNKIAKIYGADYNRPS